MDKIEALRPSQSQSTACTSCRSPAAMGTVPPQKLAAMGRELNRRFLMFPVSQGIHFSFFAYRSKKTSHLQSSLVEGTWETTPEVHQTTDSLKNTKGVPTQTHIGGFHVCLESQNPSNKRSRVAKKEYNCRSHMNQWLPIKIESMALDWILWSNIVQEILESMTGWIRACFGPTPKRQSGKLNLLDLLLKPRCTQKILRDTHVCSNREGQLFTTSVTY